MSAKLYALSSGPHGSYFSAGLLTAIHGNRCVHVRHVTTMVPLAPFLVITVLLPAANSCNFAGSAQSCSRVCNGRGHVLQAALLYL